MAETTPPGRRPWDERFADGVDRLLDGLANRAAALTDAVFPPHTAAEPEPVAGGRDMDPTAVRHRLGQALVEVRRLDIQAPPFAPHDDPKVTIADSLADVANLGRLLADVRAERDQLAAQVVAVLAEADLLARGTGAVPAADVAWKLRQICSTPTAAATERDQLAARLAAVTAALDSLPAADPNAPSPYGEFHVALHWERLATRLRAIIAGDPDPWAQPTPDDSAGGGQ